MLLCELPCVSAARAVADWPKLCNKFSRIVRMRSLRVIFVSVVDALLADSTWTTNHRRLKRTMIVIGMWNNEWNGCRCWRRRRTMFCVRATRAYSSGLYQSVVNGNSKKFLPPFHNVVDCWCGSSSLPYPFDGYIVTPSSSSIHHFLFNFVNGRARIHTP